MTGTGGVPELAEGRERGGARWARVGWVPSGCHAGLGQRGALRREAGAGGAAVSPPSERAPRCVVHARAFPPPPLLHGPGPGPGPGPGAARPGPARPRGARSRGPRPAA